MKESSGYIVKDKYSKIMKKLISVGQINLYFDQEIRPGNRSNKTNEG